VSGSEIPISCSPSDSEIPQRRDTDISSQRSPLAELTADLMKLAGIDRPANPDDLGCVMAWTAEGFSPDAMRAVIETKRGQMNGKPTSTLKYFDGPMRQTREVARPSTGHTSAPAPTPAPSPVPEADRVLQELLAPSNDAWLKDRSCPYPPSLNTFKAACADEKTERLAYRWLDLSDLWAKSGRGAATKPPDFTLLSVNPTAFEIDMLEIEDELTGPDPPPLAAD
jgi:hypothetical protein